MTANPDSRTDNRRGPGPRRRRAPNAGVTLVELVVATALFTIMSLGTLAAMIQGRRMAENNVAQAIAAEVAQGIIEQVLLDGYTSVTTDPTIPLKFTGVTSANLASIQGFDLPWAADSTTFTDIGARVNPADATSAVLGVLVDFDYMNGSVVIRPRRYMKMRVNLQRNAHTTDDNVEIILTYSWQPPANAGGNGRYLTREIRTIRSETPSY